MILCQRCGKEFNDTFADCPFCGARKKLEEAPTGHQPTCPRCSAPLKVTRLRGNEIDICPQCRGVWLDMDEFLFFVSKRDVFNDDTVPKRFEKKPIEPTGDQKIYFPCPRCGTRMSRKNFKSVSGVIIDICPNHGVWLDSGELEQIRSFVANTDQEQILFDKIELNQEEIRTLRSELKDIELVQLATDFWNLKYWLYKRR